MDRHLPDPWTDAQDAAEGLRAALDAIGITLPALGVDVPGVLAGYPLVSLGAAPAATVRRLTAQLRAAP